MRREELDPRAAFVSWSVCAAGAFLPTTRAAGLAYVRVSPLEPVGWDWSFNSPRQRAYSSRSL